MPLPEACDTLKGVNLTGNVVPNTWYSTLTKDNESAYLKAIILLSDIVYWYIPREVRDEQTGQTIGHEKKFQRDKLQRSKAQFAERYGMSKKSVQRALRYLEERGLIEREYRTLEVNGKTLSNVMFIDLNAGKMLKMTQQGSGQTRPQGQDNLTTGSGQTDRTYTGTTNTGNTNTGEPAREDETPVDVYCDAFPRRPTNFQKEKMNAEVDDLDTWSEVVEWWAVNGYKAKSVGKMMDKYQKTKEGQPLYNDYGAHGNKSGGGSSGTNGRAVDNWV